MTHVAPEPSAAPIPRGRHAPPLEVRVEAQRSRLFAAAGAVFAEVGYADATAEAISRRAGMSKATFYEHFANKEECILALFDRAAAYVMEEMARELGSPDDAESYEAWVSGSLASFLGILAAHPQQAQTLLVEVIGAGPRAIARRDGVMDGFTDLLLRNNAVLAPRFGHATFATREDAYGCIGATFELVSRQLRTGQPEDIRDLGPTLARIVRGVLHEAARG